MKTRNLNFNKIKKYLIRIAEIIGGFMVFIMISGVLNKMYVNEDELVMARVLWHYFYEDKGRIQNICLGSSHVYSDINPTQLGGINGRYNFNLASSSQKLNGSYYLLKEADRNNSLSEVYLDLYYTGSTKTGFSPDLDPINTSQHWNWQNTDCMETSINKLEYMLSIAGPEKYIEIFLPFSRYRSNLDDWDYIKERLERKNSEDYLNYKCRTDFGDSYNEYVRQGYYFSTKEVVNEKSLLLKSGGLYEQPLGETSEKYLHKIIRYCQKHNIKITLFATPVNDFQLINLGNYDRFVETIRGIADAYGIEFYDFNLVKEEYLSIQHKEYFRDFTHMNAKGAAIFTEFFARVMSGSASDNEKYFYCSYEEKLRNEAPKIYGLYYKDIDNVNTENDAMGALADADENGSDDAVEESELGRAFWVASNRDAGMEYRIIMSPENGEQYMVQDFAENKEFEVAAAEHGICTIVGRMKDMTEEVETLEINY